MNTTFHLTYVYSYSVDPQADSQKLVASTWEELVKIARETLLDTNNSIMSIYAIQDGKTVFPSDDIFASMKEMILKW